MTDFDSIIIGAGFFGLNLGVHLAREHDQKVLILEKESEVMQKASYVNQARVHNGYHYPRNLLTAYRSRKFYPIFIEDFKEAIVDSFDSYYAIANLLGKVSARQFVSFCKTIGVPVEAASPNVKKIFNSDLIEEVFQVDEVAFDSRMLRNILLDRIDQKNITLVTGCEASSVSEANHKLRLKTCSGDIHSARNIFNCSYSQINQLLSASNLPLIELKHELTELCLVKPSKPFQGLGLTVMCGPFFSTIPFPAESLHSFSHVRYTPHGEYFETEQNYKSPEEMADLWQHRSRWKKMIKDAARYVPCLEDSEYVKSLWQIKTILPRNEANDGRPILFNSHHHLQGLHCIMGGKIDNVYDMVALTEQIIKDPL